LLNINSIHLACPGCLSDAQHSFHVQMARKLPSDLPKLLPQKKNWQHIIAVNHLSNCCSTTWTEKWQQNKRLNGFR